MKRDSKLLLRSLPQPDNAGNHCKSNWFAVPVELMGAAFPFVGEEEAPLAERCMLVYMPTNVAVRRTGPTCRAPCNDTTDHGPHYSTNVCYNGRLS